VRDRTSPEGLQTGGQAGVFARRTEHRQVPVAVVRRCAVPPPVVGVVADEQVSPSPSSRQVEAQHCLRSRSTCQPARKPAGRCENRRQRQCFQSCTDWLGSPARCAVVRARLDHTRSGAAIEVVEGITASAPAPAWQLEEEIGADARRRLARGQAGALVEQARQFAGAAVAAVERSLGRRRPSSNGSGRQIRWSCRETETCR
jgi:hypothetical protein